MRAIVTKYLGPTASLPSRVQASAGRGANIILARDALPDSAHGAAARALCEKMGWSGALIGGGFENGSMVWVFEDSPDRA